MAPSGLAGALRGLSLFKESGIFFVPFTSHPQLFYHEHPPPHPPHLPPTAGRRLGPEASLSLSTGAICTPSEAPSDPSFAEVGRRRYHEQSLFCSTLCPRRAFLIAGTCSSSSPRPVASCSRPARVAWPYRQSPQSNLKDHLSLWARPLPSALDHFDHSSSCSSTRRYCS